jgi:hypothetical protein
VEIDKHLTAKWEQTIKNVDITFYTTSTCLRILTIYFLYEKICLSPTSKMLPNSQLVLEPDQRLIPNSVLFCISSYFSSSNLESYTINWPPNPRKNCKLVHERIINSLKFPKRLKTKQPRKATPNVGVTSRETLA